MRLALNTVTIQPAPLFTKIDAVAQAGFTGIEFHVYEIYDHLIDGGSLSDVQKKLSDSGLEIPSMLGFRNWGDLQHHDYQLHLFEARRRLRLCANLGCPYLVCSTPMYDPDWSHLHERYQDLLDIGREEGCSPAFEFIGHYASIKNLKDAQTMLDRADRGAIPSSETSNPPPRPSATKEPAVRQGRPPEARANSATGSSVTLARTNSASSAGPAPDSSGTLVVDFFHLWNGGSSLDDLRALPLERIAHIHIDDAAPNIPAGQQDDSHRTLPGHGPVPIADYLTILRDKGYNGYLSLELFDRALQTQDPFLTAQQAYDSTVAFLR
jgi:sugar phosphate isomerase/epimerase